jgi:drug/metabolite transporter (DMT)-like permease
MRIAVLVTILIVGIIWGLLPHMNKHGAKVEGIVVYTSKRYTTAALVVILCATMYHYTRSTDEPTSSMVTLSLATVAGVISALSFLAYMWCLADNDPSVVTSLVYVIGLMFAAIFGAYFEDESLTIRQKIGVAATIIACSLLCC